MENFGLQASGTIPHPYGKVQRPNTSIGPRCKVAVGNGRYLFGRLVDEKNGFATVLTDQGRTVRRTRQNVHVKRHKGIVR